MKERDLKESKHRHGQPKFPGLKGLTAVLALFSLVNSAFGFTNSGVLNSPNLVQAVKADLEFFGTPEQTIPVGGFVQITAPSQVGVNLEGISCFDVINAETCSVTVKRKTFEVQLTKEVEAGTQFQFQILQGINNPVSTQPTDSFIMTTSAGETQTKNMILTSSPGYMEKYVLNPVSKVVGAMTTLQVRWRSQHTIPRNGYIFLEFPKWNPENKVSSQIKNYIQGSEKCTSLNVLSEDLTCDFQNGMLIVKNAAPATIDAGLEVGFEVTGFKNPIETGQISGFVIKTAIKSGTDYFVVDEDETSLSVTEYASISPQNIKFSVIDETSPIAGMIQEQNDMLLDFYLPVPLNAGCKVDVTLPVQYSVSTVKKVTTLKVFGPQRDYIEEDGTLLINQEANSFSINPCKTYIENDLVATIYISSLIQPDYEVSTDSVKITINSREDQYIAMIQSGVTFTPVRGKASVQSNASHFVVQELTNVMLEIKPQHAIYLKDQPEIIIEFPQELQISTTQCEIRDVQLTGSSGQIFPKCFRFEQQFVVKQFLSTDYLPQQNQTIKMTVGQIKNAVAVQQVKGLRVTIKAFGKYAIDDFSGDAGWIPVQGTFSSAKVITSSSVSYEDDTTYTIKFTPKHMIPVNGFVDVSIPKEIYIPDKSYTQSSCKAVSGSAFPTISITCEFVDREKEDGNDSYYILRILNAFRRTSVQGGKEFSFEIPGLRNPIHTKPTKSFKFVTYSQEGNTSHIIDVSTDITYVQMLKNAELNSVQVNLGSYTNSLKTDYTFTMVPTVPVLEDNIIYITFPEQISIPENPADLACTSTPTTLINQVTCTYDSTFKNDQKTVRIDLLFDHGVNQIDALDRFSLTLNNIKNPETTQMSDSIKVAITQVDKHVINSKEKDIYVNTNNPYTITKASVSANTPQPYVNATFTLKFNPEHAIRQGGGILVGYPPQTTLAAFDGKISATVKIDGLSVDQSKIKIASDSSARAILITNIIQDVAKFTPTEDSEIQVDIIGLKTPFTSAPTDSFQISTFNLVDNTFYYYIDNIEEGLSVYSKCNYPCKDCPSSDPDLCLSCYQNKGLENGLPKLQEGKCVAECATGRYYNKDSLSCEKCDPTCLACDKKADNCTLCGIDDYLFLHYGKCLTECPDRFIEEPQLNKCSRCQAKCKTCEDLATSCTSCDFMTPHRYLFRESCIDSCIPDISVLVDDQCVECSPLCATCSGTPDTCTSCAPHMKFDEVKATCEDLCEPEIQIYKPNPDDPTLAGTCEYCTNNCAKCAGTTSTCTACPAGFFLNLDQTCQDECKQTEEFPNNQTSVDGVCRECEKPCASCDGATAKCTSCIPGYFLFQGSQCLQYCPEKYEERGDICFRVGLVCPDEFERNEAGDGCIPKEYDCREGYTINDQKTACIPAPGSQIPFPFLLVSILISLLVLGSYLKEKYLTKVISNLICLIGALEIPMQFLMVSYALSLDEMLIFLFAVLGLVFQFVANIIFTVQYKKEIVSKDDIFRKWLQFFPRTQFLLPVCCIFVNFKCSKILYSGFYGLESSMAKFKDYKKFYFWMRVTTYFSFIFVYGFIFIADIIIFFKIKWGYQLLILGIETSVLQLLMIILTIIEFRKRPSQLLNSYGDEFTMIKPTNMKQLKVRSGIEDDYQEGIPDMDENTLIRSKVKVEEHEIHLRQQAFARIISQINQQYLQNQQAETQSGQEGNRKSQPMEQTLENIRGCLTRFNPDQIKMRRAFSMTSLRSETSWVAESENGEPHTDDEQENSIQKLPKAHVQNYDVEEEGDQSPNVMKERRYSFPLSPSRRNIFINPMPFERKIDEIKAQWGTSDMFQFNNVIAEVILPETPRKPKKTVSRRTQTRQRDLTQDFDPFSDDQYEPDRIGTHEDPELDINFVAELIDQVVDHISDASEDFAENQEEPLVKKKKVKKIKRTFKAAKKIPEFELDEIMGDFHIDDLGNYIMTRGPEGELLDSRDRRVNQRGYLIDKAGNVINIHGQIVFKAVELDFDGEIPAPFGFEKKRKNFLRSEKNQNKFTVPDLPENRLEIGESLNKLNITDEDMLNQEIQQIKNSSKKDTKMFDAKSSMKSMKSGRSKSRKSRKSTVSRRQSDNSSLQQIQDEPLREQDLEIQDDRDENMLEDQIDQIIKKKSPKKRSRLRGGRVKKSLLDNKPPKRIRPNDVNEMFAIPGFEHEEQRRLAKIASGISGLASQLAQKQQKFNEQVSNIPIEWSDLRYNRNQMEQRSEQGENLEYSSVPFKGNQGRVQSVQQDVVKRNATGGFQSNVRLKHELTMDQSQVNKLMPQFPFQKRGRSALPIHLRSNQMRGDPNDQLRKVYCNRGDLMSAQSNELGNRDGSNSQHRMKRGQSGSSQNRGRIAGLENIFFSKVGKNQSKNKKQVDEKWRSEHNPFRPTLNKFEDEPAALNVNTLMSGSEVQGKDISKMYDEIEKMQRGYLQDKNVRTTHGKQESRLPPEHLNMTDMNPFYPHSGTASINVRNPDFIRGGLQNQTLSVSGMRQVADHFDGAQSENFNSFDPVQKDNWVMSQKGAKGNR